MNTDVDERSIALRNWRNAVICAFALGGLVLSTFGPRLPSIRSDLDVDNGLLGIILAGMTLGAFVGLGTSSPIIAWLGARRAVLAILLTVAISLGLLGVSAGVLHVVPLAALAFALLGFASGAVDVILNVEASTIERTAGRSLLPFMHASWSIGVIAGAALGAGCAAAQVPIAAQLGAEAVLIALSSVVLVRFLPGYARDVPNRRSRRAQLREWASGWGDRRVLLIGVFMLGVALSGSTASNWLTLTIRDDYHQSEAVSALFFMAFAAAELTARVFGSPFVDRFGRVAVSRVSVALAMVGLVLVISASTLPIVLIGTVAWGLGASLGFPLGISAAAESGPHPARQVSVASSVGYLAGLAGAPFIGLISQWTGLLGAFWFVAAFLALAFALTGTLRRSPRIASVTHPLEP